MLNMTVVTKLSRLIGRAGLIISKKMPTILTVLGIGGWVGTTISASSNTLKMPDILAEHKNREEELEAKQAYMSDKEFRKAKTQEKLRFCKEVAVNYALPVGLGIASTAAIGVGHSVLLDQNAKLIAACASLDKAYKALKAKMQGDIPEEVEKEAGEGKEAGKDGEERGYIWEYDPTARPYAVIFDELNPNWKINPVRRWQFLLDAERLCNEKLHIKGHLFLNEVYDILGYSDSQAGAVVGWFIPKEDLLKDPLRAYADTYVSFGLNTPEARRFSRGEEVGVLLDFNVQGVIFNLLDDGWRFNEERCIQKCLQAPKIQSE